MCRWLDRRNNDGSVAVDHDVDLLHPGRRFFSSCSLPVHFVIKAAARSTQSFWLGQITRPFLCVWLLVVMVDGPSQSRNDVAHLHGICIWMEQMAWFVCKMNENSAPKWHTFDLVAVFMSAGGAGRKKLPVDWRDPLFWFTKIKSGLLCVEQASARVHWHSVDLTTLSPISRDCGYLVEFLISGATFHAGQSPLLPRQVPPGGLGCFLRYRCESIELFFQWS